MSNEELCFIGAMELTEGYRLGKFSPSDVTAAYLKRIRRLDGKLHAFVEIFDDEAIRQGEESTARFAQNRPRPLEGLPVALKDLIEIEGRVSLAGSKTREGVVSTTTAEIARQLATYGAIVLGKVHTVEYAFGAWGTNEYLGTPWNPWVPCTHYTPGGSSSGGGVAVAARLSPLSIGTDTGGSIRVPAAFNDVVGLKPTIGRLSTQGIIPLSPTLDTPGVIARSTRDAAYLFQVLANGLHEEQPMLLEQIEGGVAGIRLATISPADRVEIDDEVMRAYDSAIDVWRKLGASISEVPFEYSLLYCGKDAPILQADAFALYGDLAKDPTQIMDASVRRRILSGAEHTSGYQEALEKMKRSSAGFLTAMAPFDALIAPTTLTPPRPVDEIDIMSTPALMTRAVNTLGMCALALPCGYSAAGLPLSMQIILQT